MLVTSCQKEKTEREGNFSISASREALQTGTKATVSDLGAFSWSAGDAIGLYDGRSGSSFSKLTTAESGTTVTFAGTVVGTPSNCAIFPYAIAKTPTSVTLPDTYQWKAGDVQAAMIAPYNASGLSFKHLGGIIKVSLKNVPATATKFVLKADKDITGDFAITTVSGNNQISSSADNGKKSVAFTFAAGTATDMAFYVPVPVGNYVISSVSLQNAGGTTLWEFAGSTANDVTRAKLLIMPTLTIVSIPGSGENTGISVSIPANYSGTFYLPETTSDVVLNVEATANPVVVAYKSGAAAAKPANVTIDCGSNTITNFTINLPESHVELKGTAYTTLVSQTSLSTLVINNGTKVNTLKVQEGSVDVKGEVTDMSIASTVQNEAVVRISDAGKVTTSLKNDSQAEIQKSAAAAAGAIPTVTGTGKTVVVTTNKDAVNDIVKTLSEGGNVTLTENLDLYNPVEIYGTTNLALGGYSITAQHSDEFVFAVHNGATFNITGSGTIDGSNNVLAIKLTVKDDDPSKPAVLNIKGEKDAARCEIKGQYYAISGNGSRNNTDLTLKYVDCYATNGEDGTAIYQPQVGKMTLTYTKCEGFNSGVEIRSGEAVFGYKTELISKALSFSANPNDNGTTAVGAALAVSQHTTDNPIKVKVTGTCTGPVSVFCGDIQNNLEQDKTYVELGGTCNGDVEHRNGELAITAGTYNGNIHHIIGQLSITKGTFNGELKIEDASEKFVSGGTFATELPVSYLTDEVKIKKITSTGLCNYLKSLTTLSSGEYILIGDLTNSRICTGSAMSSNNNVIINLNGHTLTSTATDKTYPAFYFHPSSSGNTITFKNGTLKINEGSFIGISAKGNNKYILDNGFTIETPVGGILLEGSASLVMNTGAKIINTGECAAIQTNGSTGNNSNITINGGQIVSDGVGVYKPDAGALTINGGEISGKTAVYVKSGTTTITGGVLNGRAAKSEYVYAGNGYNPTGDAFVVDNCGYPGGTPVVSVTGGTFNSSKAAAIGSYAGNGQSEIVKGFVEKSGVTLNPVLAEDSELWK